MNSLREEVEYILDGADIYSTEKAKQYTNDIIKLFEKRINSIERYPSNNEYQVCWNKGADDIIKQIKELLK